MQAFVYILECANGKYYTGSTKNLERRLAEHESGEGANFTKKHLPVKLVYFEEYDRIDTAFYREKQIQGWSRAKKEALINGQANLLPSLSLRFTSRLVLSIVEIASVTDTSSASVIDTSNASVSMSK